MSRPESKFTAAGPAGLDAAELVAAFEAQLANARRDQQRYARLIKEDATTRQQLDTQNALVSQLEAAVQMDAAQVSYAKVQLGYTTITAPIGGRTGVRLVDAATSCMPPTTPAWW